MRIGRLGSALVLSALLGAVPATAIEFRAEVDRDTLALGDTLILTLTLSGELKELPRPELPTTDDFEQYDRGTSQRMSFVGGQMNVEMIHRVELIPRRAGELQIPSAAVSIAGEQFRTRAIEIHVLQEAELPDPGPGSPRADESPDSVSGEVELKASLEPVKVYLGQQAIYNLRVFRRIRWESPRLEDVSFEGFWVEEFASANRETRTTIEGQAYLYQDLRYALFPSTPGTHELSPRSIRYSRLSGSDFFFALPRPAPPVASNQVTLEVLPIPEDGRPDGFSGIVGRIALEATLDKTTARQDEAVTLTLVVSGIGNPNLYPEPPLSLDKSIEIFETHSDVYVNNKRDLVSGSKTYRTVIVPRQAGSFTFGPFELSVFDPYAEEFIQVESAPATLTVTPSEASFLEPSDSERRAEKSQLELLGADIRYLKSVRTVRSAYRGLVHTRWWFAACFLVPLAVVVGLHSYWRRLAVLSSNTLLRRRRLAGRTADKRLQALSTLSEDSEFYRGLERALLGYIADQLGCSVRGSSWSDLRLELAERKVPESLLEKISRFTETCNFFRFSAHSEGEIHRDQLLDSGRVLLDSLRRELKR